MKNILYALNSRGTNLEPLFVGEDWIKNEISDLNEIDYDLVKSNRAILLICCGDRNIVKDLFTTFELRSSNLPTAFMLDYEDPEIIDLCFRNDFTNVFVASERHRILKSHIEYVYNNYEMSVRSNGQKWLRHIDPNNFTKKEYQIIEYIAQAPMTELSREELQGFIWGNARNTTNKLDVHICNLRKKLNNQNVVIQTNERGKVSLGFSRRSNFEKKFVF